MKIHLLQVAEGKVVFRAEKSAGREENPPRHGFRGWIERKAKQLKTTWSQADRGAAGKVRSFWEKLQRRMPADESMLARLRKASEVEIYYPDTLSSEEAEALWAGYIARCQRRHLPWMVINGLISPISLLLAPLPGPNLLGYWFAYRAVKDMLALLGLRHARDPRVATTYRPAEILAISESRAEFASLSGSHAFEYTAVAASRTFSLAANRRAD